MHVTSQRKVQNLNLEVLFVLNVYYFCTIVSQKIVKLNHCKLRTIWSEKLYNMG